MTRRNDKRNQRRNRKEDNASSIAASVLFGAIMHKIFGDSLGEKKEETKMKDIVDEPFHGVRKVSDNHLECGVILPSDGTAVEIPTPEGYQVFISEDGKPMIRKVVEGDAEEAQSKKLRAFCKLLDITKQLNDGWEPDFDDAEQDKYFIYYQGGGYSFKDGEEKNLNFGIYSLVDEPFYPSGAYFKTEKLARKAIDIMGEESLTDLFINNY